MRPPLRLAASAGPERSAEHVGEDAGVGCGLVVLGEDFEHDHAWPPVVIGGGAEVAAGLLRAECPVDELLSLGFEAGIVEHAGLARVFEDAICHVGFG